MTMSYRITDEHNYGDRKVVAFATEMPDQEATYAFALLERWGVVAAKPDGEDSAGRQQLGVLSVEETVVRAFDVSREAFRLARERGLMLKVPDLNELNAEKDAERAAKAEAKKAKETA